MKKKKNFYDDKKRNQKWTEPEQGRVIDFADKYLYDGSYSDKYDYKRPSKKNEAEKKKKEKRKKSRKNFLIFIMCIALVCIGYTGMDVYITRHERPVENLQGNETQETGNMSQIDMNISSVYIDSVSLDSSVMLSSVIEETISKGYTSVTFDIKRADGTIGYNSSLASVDTFGAVSTPAPQPEASVKELLANDLLPVARICCYKDNIIPIKSTDTAVMKNNKVYSDSNSNTYLNPDNETAYNYIKDIIEECYSYGINVFVLYGCDLPEEISQDYNDGFKILTEKLEKDLGGNIKFYEEIDTEITGKDSQTGKTTNNAIKKDISLFKKIKSNQIYFVSTKADDKKVLEQLQKSNVSGFIING